MHVWIQRGLKTLTVCTALLLQQAAVAQDTAPKVVFQTTQGNFTVEVYPDKSPKTVENFLRYVKDKHYNGTVFHRVIPNFMVQGGGFTPNMQQKTTRDPIPLEANNSLKNDRGTIAMARTANPQSATAQFFINVVDNQNLNAPRPDGHGYAVFGKVVQGMDVIDKIRGVPTTNAGMYQDVPQTPVVINSATLAP
ncbi:MAG: peptidylprolyl isomerase [Rhodoferax sp.]|uniref:peptidylprolyl isomerase n=1 Tax=Rhodoferax sp. TaxID=50421 RepID=UPI002ACDEB4D|nr:peptidylprolyl isomerase [Rhodoferax sp.]MDZ7892013.1 peptidylprolyl isomerase [Rhodoferax sp.]